MTVKQNNWRDEMLATGILGKNGAKISFSRIEPLSGTTYFQAEGETKEDEPKRVIICFGSETKVMDVRYIDAALDEAESIRPRPVYIIFAAFQFGPKATQLIDDIKWPDVTVLKVQMNTDLMTEDLKKKTFIESELLASRAARRKAGEVRQQERLLPRASRWL